MLGAYIRAIGGIRKIVCCSFTHWPVRFIAGNDFEVFILVLSVELPEFDFVAFLVLGCPLSKDARWASNQAKSLKTRSRECPSRKVCRYISMIRSDSLRDWIPSCLEV
jgi:hypothetical protein